MKKDLVLKSLYHLARPLVSLCVRNGIKLGELIDTLKRVYVRCSIELLESEEKEVSTSRITVISGVHRTDVAAIRDEGEFVPHEHHTASEVINKWRYNTRFCRKPGNPKPLSCEGKESEFAQLVKSVSLSISPYTVLFELERLGLIKRDLKGVVKLQSRVFVPHGDSETILNMMGEDAEDLFQAVESNAFATSAPAPHHHLKTEYDNIPDSHVEEIRSWLLREGSALHEKARNFISKFDRDLNPTVSGEGRNRVALGSFSFISPSKVKKGNDTHE